MSIPRQLSIYDFLDIPQPKRIIKTNLGLVYRGSKRKLAYDLLCKINELAPNATYFYDLFGGGGAMSINACLNGYITHYNELDTKVYSLLAYIFNKENKGCEYGAFPKHWYNFVSKDEFLHIREQVKKGYNDPYYTFVLLTYSFGCDMTFYFCNKEKEIFKQNAHNFVVHRDKEAQVYLCNHFKHSHICNKIITYMSDYVYPHIDNLQERRILFVDMFEKLDYIDLIKLDLENKSDKVCYEYVRTLSKRELFDLVLKHNPQYKDKGYKRLSDIKIKKNIQNLEQLSRLERLAQIDKVVKSHSNIDYKRVNIPHKPQDTIIYLDPPYKNTIGYKTNGKCTSSFDYETYYNYCIDKAKQGYNVFCSEYDMPSDRFECVLELQTLCSATNYNTNADKRLRIEKLFKPRI